MFGSVLRQLRGKRKLTQRELGKVLHISESTVGMYERGEREPDLETLKAIADYFRVETDFLIGRSFESDQFGDAAELVKEATVAYRKTLQYAITGCKSQLWKTAFDLNSPELTGKQAQETAEKLRQMAHDLAGYEAEAARIGGV